VNYGLTPDESFVILELPQLRVKFTFPIEPEEASGRNGEKVSENFAAKTDQELTGKSCAAGGRCKSPAPEY
jgi:hypothetical protein